MKDINEFLNWYYKGDENYFITLIDNKTKKTQNYYNNKNTINNNIGKILYQNEKSGKSVYFTINSYKEKKECDLNEWNVPRKTKTNVTKIKSIVFDFDEPLISKECLQNLLETTGLIPTYILKTSPGKFQVCYKIDDEDINHLEYELINKTLTKKFDSDENVCSVEKVFRLPFTINRKNDFRTELLQFNGDLSYSFNTFKDLALKYIDEDEDLKKYYLEYKEKQEGIIKVPTKKVSNNEVRIDNETTLKIDSNMRIPYKDFNKYQNLLKYNNNDASIADIHYVRYRAKNIDDYDRVFNEILFIRDKLDKPLKRDAKEYYKDRFDIFCEENIPKTSSKINTSASSKLDEMMDKEFIPKDESKSSNKHKHR